MSYNTTVYRRQGDGAVVTSGQTAVTQATSVTTGVTCNALSGVITTFAQSAAAGAEVEFTVTNSEVAATDVVVASIKTHTSAGSFTVHTTATAAGSFKLMLTNLHASTAGDGVLVINFVVIKCA